MKLFFICNPLVDMACQLLASVMDMFRHFATSAVGIALPDCLNQA
jgi:hypothetical protein